MEIPKTNDSHFSFTYYSYPFLTYEFSVSLSFLLVVSISLSSYATFGLSLGNEFGRCGIVNKAQTNVIRELKLREGKVE